jgi:hypothetical protein
MQQRTWHGGLGILSVLVCCLLVLVLLKLACVLLGWFGLVLVVCPSRAL